jgi:hypothetical protein
LIGGTGEASQATLEGAPVTEALKRTLGGAARGGVAGAALGAAFTGVGEAGRAIKTARANSPKVIQGRLEYLRTQLNNENISYGELAELQSLAKHIPAGDAQLLEAAGVPEGMDPKVWAAQQGQAGYFNPNAPVEPKPKAGHPKVINLGDENGDVKPKAGFQAKWKSTDGWRGYYETVPDKGSGWEKMDEGWVTGNWEDAGDNAASKVEAKMIEMNAKVKAAGGEMVLVTAPTSNVFSTGYDVFIRGLSPEAVTAIKTGGEIPAGASIPIPTGRSTSRTNAGAVGNAVAGEVTKGSKNIFAEKLPDGSTAIYSYGKHFPMAVIDAKGNAVVNTDKYSPTTSRHQSLLRNELSAQGIKTTNSTTEKMISSIEGSAAPAPDLSMKGGASYGNEQAGIQEAVANDAQLPALAEKAKQFSSPKAFFDALSPVERDVIRKAPFRAGVSGNQNIYDFFADTTGAEPKTFKSSYKVTASAPLMRDLKADNPNWFTSENKKFFNDKSYTAMYGGETGQPYLVRSTEAWTDMFGEKPRLHYRINKVTTTPDGKTEIGELLDQEFPDMQAVKQFLGKDSAVKGGGTPPTGTEALPNMSNQGPSTTQGQAMGGDVGTPPKLLNYKRQSVADKGQEGFAALNAPIGGEKPPVSGGAIPEKGTNLFRHPEAAKKTYYTIEKQSNGKWGVTWVSGRDNGSLVSEGGDYTFANPKQAEKWALTHKGQDMSGGTGEIMVGKLPQKYAATLKHNDGIRGGFVDNIMAYEDGSMSDADTIKMFQKMVDDGSVWSLQGSYGRQAQSLIDQGLVKLPKSTKGMTDAYGNKIPTQKEYETGTGAAKGSKLNKTRLQEGSANLGSDIMGPPSPSQLAYQATRKLQDKASKTAAGKSTMVGNMAAPDIALEKIFNGDVPKYVRGATDDSIKIKTDTGGVNTLTRQDVEQYYSGGHGGSGMRGVGGIQGDWRNIEALANIAKSYFDAVDEAIAGAKNRGSAALPAGAGRAALGAAGMAALPALAGGAYKAGQKIGETVKAFTRRIK